MEESRFLIRVTDLDVDSLKWRENENYSQATHMVNLNSWYKRCQGDHASVGEREIKSNKIASKSSFIRKPNLKMWQNKFGSLLSICIPDY